MYSDEMSWTKFVFLVVVFTFSTITVTSDVIAIITWQPAKTELLVLNVVLLAVAVVALLVYAFREEDETPLAEGVVVAKEKREVYSGSVGEPQEEYLLVIQLGKQRCHVPVTQEVYNTCTPEGVHSSS